MLSMRVRSSAKRIQGGFTLIEILVVIAIIGVLVALTAVAVTKVISGQRISNTKSAMATIQKTLNEHWAYVVSEAKKETGLESVFAAMESPALFGPDTTGGERNRLLWIKVRLMEAFPSSFLEITAPWPYVSNIIPLNLRKYNATYAKALSVRPTNPSKTKAITESAACLLMALSVMRNGTVLDPDALGSAVADTDGDNLKEFVDGWGNPLTFFRFPTDSKALQATYPSASPYADPVDPAGVLFNWPPNAGRANFEARVHKIAFPYNTKVAAYVQPTLVSMGPNGDMNALLPPNLPPPRQTPIYGLGLTAGMDISKEPGNPGLKVLSGADEEADNIYSFQLP
jgi:prepilin-type N-terminal cleavage/methylation domain-containing protein